MTAPTTDATADTSAGGDVTPEGQAPEDTTTTASAGEVGERARTTTRARGERVRTSSRDDDAPRDTDDGDAGDDKAAGKDGDKAASNWRIEDLPPGAQKLIGDLRKEAGSRRTEAAEAKKAAQEAAKKAAAGDDRFAQATEAFMKALGLTPEADEPDRSPEELLEDITTKYSESRTELAQSRIELAVYRAASAHGADADALLDSRGFLAKAHALDPAAENFTDAIADAIADAVDSNPKLRAVTVTPVVPAAPSGGDFGGGPAGRIGPDEWSVDDFRRARNNGART